MTDDALITLDEAAKLIPGADADALKRMHRAGKLICYKPGKKLLTTAENVKQAVRVNYRATPAAARSRPASIHPASLERSKAALDLVLAQLRTKKKKRSP